MSESTAETRVSELLHEMREAPVPAGERLPAAVIAAARWQRPLRRVLVAAGAAGGGVVDGVLGLVRRRRP